MKLNYLIAISLFGFFTLSADAQRRKRTATKRPQPSAMTASGAIDEESAVRKLIDALLLAQSEFFQNHDPESVFRFYTNNYYEASEGRERSLSDLRTLYAKATERLTLGSPLRRSLTRTDDARIQIRGGTAVVSYHISDKVGQQGAATRTRTGVCTDILVKQHSKWLVMHEHCSNQLAQAPGPG